MSSADTHGRLTIDLCSTRSSHYHHDIPGLLFTAIGSTKAKARVHSVVSRPLQKHPLEMTPPTNLPTHLREGHLRHSFTAVTRKRSPEWLDPVCRRQSRPLTPDANGCGRYSVYGAYTASAIILRSSESCLRVRAEGDRPSQLAVIGTNGGVFKLRHLKWMRLLITSCPSGPIRPGGRGSPPKWVWTPGSVPTARPLQHS